MPDESLVKAEAWRVSGDRPAPRVLRRGNVVGVRDVDDRQLAELGLGVTEPIAEGRVDRKDAAVESRKEHRRLRLFEQCAEAPLTVALGHLGAITLSDVVHQG